MPTNKETKFSLIDQYLGIQLDIPVSGIAPGETRIVESTRRLRCEQSYGYVHAFFGIWFADGRIAVSVPPGARPGVEEVFKEGEGSGFSFDPAWIERLSAPVNHSLAQAGLPTAKKTLDGRQFACNANTIRRWNTGDCRRLRDESIPPAEGLSLPTHCFPDGIVYGVIEAGQVVSIAYAHRSGILVNRVADLGVETAAAYRRRGYAKTCVSAVTTHMTGMGGEGLYNCGPSNTASMATARSVGYELYGCTLILTTSVPERK